MKSFEPFYAILSVYIPVSVLACFLSLSSLLLEHFTGPLPLGLWFTLGLLSAVSASVYWALVKKSKANHSPANIRGAILIVIITYSLGSLLNFDRSLGLRFYPSFHNIPSALSALAVWFPVVTIKRIFSGQELFESNTRQYEGEKLRQIMLEDSSLMSETDADIKKLGNYYTAAFIPSFILLFVDGALGLHFGYTLIILLIMIFTLGACIIGFLYFLRREYSYAAEGLSLAGRPKATMAAVFVVLGAAAAGLLISSDKSLLSPYILLDLLRRIAAFLESLSKPAAEQPRFEMPQQQPSGNMGLPQEFIEMMGESQPSPFWDWLKYAALAAAALLFLWFMINPLLSRSKWYKGIRGLPGKILVFLKNWFGILAKGIAGFIRSLGEGSGAKKIIPVSKEALKRLEEDILGTYSPAKRRELRRSISLFARLIYWGTQILKITWKPSHAPMEYCTLLAKAAPETGIIRAGELFEKALYSLNPLSINERSEFSDLVEKITALNPEEFHDKIQA